MGKYETIKMVLLLKFYNTRKCSQCYMTSNKYGKTSHLGCNCVQKVGRGQGGKKAIRLGQRLSGSWVMLCPHLIFMVVEIPVQ